MTPSSKKEWKSAAKQAKKAAKLEQKVGKRADGVARAGSAKPEGSPAVRYAEFVRGILSVILGASIIAALVLGHRGAIVSLDDIIDSLFAARAGKVVLALIALALIIYGLKYLRVVR